MDTYNLQDSHCYPQTSPTAPNSKWGEPHANYVTSLPSFWSVVKDIPIPHSKGNESSFGSHFLSPTPCYPGTIARGPVSQKQSFRADQSNVNIIIPVDTQTASKDASEKRKRNAAASARFRVRRKEKERTSCKIISKLENELLFWQGKAEHYRKERDHWKSIAVKFHPELDTARPSSPSSRDDYEEESSEERYNVEKKISSYHPAQGSLYPDTSVTYHGSRNYTASTSAQASLAPTQPHQFS